MSRAGQGARAEVPGAAPTSDRGCSLLGCSQLNSVPEENEPLGTYNRSIPYNAPLLAFPSLQISFLHALTVLLGSLPLKIAGI